MWLLLEPLLTLIILLISPRCFCKGVGSSLSAEHQTKDILWLHKEKKEQLKLLFIILFCHDNRKNNLKNRQNLSLPSKSVSSWSRFLRKHKPVGRSTSCSSFLTRPRLLGVDVAKEMNPVKLIHSIPLWSEGNTWSISAKIFEWLGNSLHRSTIFSFYMYSSKNQHRCNLLDFLETSYLSIKRSHTLTTMMWI